MSAPRRSARAIPQINYNFGSVFTYPDGEPATDFERKIASLNQEAFHSASFSKIDDILVYALFGSKRHPQYYRACVPDTAFPDAQKLVRNEDGIKIRHIYGTYTDGEMGLAGVSEASRKLIQELPSIFKQETLPVVQHLLKRYYILYCDDSPVRLHKVSFDQRTIAMGLKAKQTICAGTAILSTCSSMSLDLIPQELASISIIQSSRGQLGPSGPRLLLGPLRFANHDCRPNCQFGAIKGTHAYVLWAIRDIDEGDSITVQYTVDTSYFPDGCACATCNPERPPVATRRTGMSECWVMDGSKKKARRGGRRSLTKRKKEVNP